MLTKLSLFVIASSLFFAGWSQNSSPASNATPLLFSNKMHELEITSSPGNVTEIKTTGRDPYIIMEPLKQQINKQAFILSFEYFSPKGINEFQV